MSRSTACSAYNERVETTGGGRPSGEAARALLGRVDAGPRWCPGKVAAAKRNGPEPALRAAKRRAVATSAERPEKTGQAPTYSQYASMFRRVVDDITANLDVEGSCKGFPKRLDLAIDAESGRIP